MQDLLAAVALVGDGARAAGPRLRPRRLAPAAITAVCEGIIFITGLWNDTMITLAMTLVATLLVMLIAVVARRVDGAQP